MKTLNTIFVGFIFVVSLAGCRKVNDGQQEEGDAAQAEDAASTEATVPGGTDPGGEETEPPMDPSCISMYDPKNPELRMTAFTFTEPEGLVEVIWDEQGAIDNLDINYLLSLSDAADGDTSGRLGTGTARDEYNYLFDGRETPVAFVLDGNAFSSIGDKTLAVLIPIASYPELGHTMVEAPLREATVSGTFKNRSRCAVGHQISDGEGDGLASEWETGGTVTGKLAVDDARPIFYTNLTRIGRVSLCALLAYGYSGGSYNDNQCEADPSEWVYPPDTTTSDGKPAWQVSATFAAVGVYIFE